MSISGSLQRPLSRPSRKIFLSSRHKTGKFRKTIKGKDYYFRPARPGRGLVGFAIRLTIYAFNPDR